MDEEQFMRVYTGIDRRQQNQLVHAAAVQQWRRFDDPQPQERDHLTMPHFNASGRDTAICQVCARIIDPDKEPDVQWRSDITGRTGAGNVCAPCIARHTAKQAAPPAPPQFFRKPYTLLDHCHTESDGLTGAALDRYISRYYRHD